MSPDDARGRGLSRQLKQGWVRTVGRACSIGYISYISLPFHFHGCHSDLVLITSFLVFKLLNRCSSIYIMIYPIKHCQINCPLTLF